MKLKTFLIITISLMFGSHLYSNEKPLNILLIFMEDLGLQFPVYGDNTVPTPGLNKLAEESVVFENAYCVQATCSPSRSALYSGQYPHQTGHMGLAGSFGYYLKPGYTTFLSKLKEANYYTGFSYKVHVHPENEIRKDYDVANDIDHIHKTHKDRGNKYYKYRTKDYNLSVEFFEEFLKNRPTDKPFFYMAQTHDTHEPFSAQPFTKAPEQEPYRTVTAKDVKPLTSFGDGISLDGYLGKHVAHYYNAIQRVDAFVTGITKTLEESGLKEETLIIFSSDHGPSFTRGKLSCHELGIRVPLMVRWPGSKVLGTRNDSLVSLLDVSATLVDASSQAIPSKYKGSSLKSFALTGASEKPWRQYFVAEYTSHTTVDYWPMRSIRGKRFKLIENKLAGTPEGEFVLAGGRVQTEAEKPDMPAGLKAPEGSSSRAIYERVKNPPLYELYDLSNDPSEGINLAENPEYESQLKNLKEQLKKWEEETNDPFAKPEFFNSFTKAQIDKQKMIRSWEEQNGKNKFWGKKVAKGNWREWIDQLP